MPPTSSIRCVIGLPILLMMRPGGLVGQSLEQMTERFMEMTAISGFEQAMADSLVQLLPAAQRDRAGNVVIPLGDGGPTRAIVCPMDEWGYVVGGIHPDGYITVRRVGSGQPAFFDQGHAARRLNVWGRQGPVPGVVGIPSTHLRRGRGNDGEPVFSADDIYIDVGANSIEQVAGLGIEMLNPVAAEKTAHRFGDSFISGSAAGQRSACAALVTAVARGPRTVGTVVVAFTVESRMGHRGLATLANGYGPFDKTLLLNYPIGQRVPQGLGEVENADIPTKYNGWQIETIDVTDVESSVTRITNWLRTVP